MSTEDSNPQLHNGKAKRKRETPAKSSTSKWEKHDDTPLDEKSIANLTTFLAKEETVLHRRAKEILNETLVTHTEAFSSLEARLDDYPTYQAALDDGFVTDVRQQLSKTYRMGVKLEAWVNSFTPPLASGGNTGVSGEVQDGIYGNIHGLTMGCSEALHRMLAFEKEYAIQRTKVTDDAVWERYRATLETNMLHDVTRGVLQAVRACWKWATRSQITSYTSRRWGMRTIRSCTQCTNNRKEMGGSSSRHERTAEAPCRSLACR